MRITLIHNPTAGDEQHSRAVLVRAISTAGHEVTYRSAKRDFKPALGQQTDLVVVAGGDGTVAKVAKQLIGRAVPLTILPVGTANNIASSLGIRASVKRLIAGWEAGQRVRFEVGVVSSSWGKARFFESVGFGLFAELMLEADSSKDQPSGSRSLELRKHVRRILNMAKNHRPRRWKLEIDDQDFSGNYLLFEAMNIRSIGPNLHLAPSADPGDRYLDLVAVTEDHRDDLLEYLSRRLERHESTSELPTWRARQVHLQWDGRPFHVDDELWPKQKRRAESGERRVKPVTVEIRLDTGSVEFLVPLSGAARERRGSARDLSHHGAG